MSKTKDKKTRGYGNGTIYSKPNGKGFIGEVFVEINGEKNAKKFPVKQNLMSELSYANCK